MQQNSNRQLTTKLKALLWYLKRPKFYGDLLSRVRGRLFRAVGAVTDTREEAERWCEAQAVDTRTALGMIGGKTVNRDIHEMFPAEFSEADRRAAACPVSMGGAADLNLIYWLCEYSNARRVIETGVAYGWSSLSILLSLRNRADGRLISTDMPYPGRGNEEYVGCVVPEDCAALWKVIRLPDRDGLPLALAELSVIDACHYDSDKSYEGRMWAYPLLWNALRPGGVLISDDIGDNVAFRDFAQSVGLDPVVIAFKNKYSGVLVKP